MHSQTHFFSSDRYSVSISLLTYLTMSTKRPRAQMKCFCRKQIFSLTVMLGLCFTFDLFAFCVKAGHNCRSFVRTIDVLSDAKKVPLCKFGIDFAFYNLARHCLALLGSCLNIFGLKTGRGSKLGLEEGYQ